MLTITERAALSRERGEHRGRERDILFARGVFETPAAYSPSIRRVHIDAYVLGHYTVAVPESSLLAGTLNTAYRETAEDVRVFEKFRELSHTTGWLGGWASGQTGHRVVDYEKLLRLGLAGVLDEVDRADAARAPWAKERLVAHVWDIDSRRLRGEEDRRAARDGDFLTVDGPGHRLLLGCCHHSACDASVCRRTPRVVARMGEVISITN